MGGRFELRKDDDTGRVYWWGSEDGWMDAAEVGVDGVLTLACDSFQVGSVFVFTEPDYDCDDQSDGEATEVDALRARVAEMEKRAAAVRLLFEEATRTIHYDRWLEVVAERDALKQWATGSEAVRVAADEAVTLYNTNLDDDDVDGVELVRKLHVVYDKLVAALSACPPLAEAVREGTPLLTTDEPYRACCTNDDCGWEGLSTELADEDQCPDCGYPTEPQQIDPPMPPA